MTPEGGWQGTVEEKAPLGEISQTICSRAYTFSSNKIDLGLQPLAPPRSLAALAPGPRALDEGDLVKSQPVWQF